MEIELAIYALCRYPVYIDRCKSNYHLLMDKNNERPDWMTDLKHTYSAC